MEQLLPYPASQPDLPGCERRQRRRPANDSPQLTDSLLETLYPHYLRAFPSCAVVRFEEGAARGGVITVARGSVLQSAPLGGVPGYKFSTASDVTLAALTLSAARLRSEPGPRAEAGACSLAITLGSSGAATIGALNLERLRVFIDGDARFCAALRDALFMRATGASVDAGTGAPAIALDAVPLGVAGLADEDALIPDAARTHPACRLLTEYFAFPEKFNFFDIDLARIAAHLPAGCRQFTLHLTLRLDAGSACALAGLSADNLILHCTPVINLFRQPGAPVSLSGAPDYALLADAARPDAFEIYSVEAVRLGAGPAPDGPMQELPPFYRQGHGHGPSESGRYWITRREPATARYRPGRELRIALVDANLKALAASWQTLHTALICSNRDLPAALGAGLPGSALTLEGRRDGVSASLLRTPGAPQRCASGAPWRPPSPGHRLLSNVTLQELQEGLARCDLARSAVARRQIDAIVALRVKVILPWIAGNPRSALMPAIEMRLALDEQAFADSSLHAFAQVADHFFSLYRRVNMSTQLVIESGRSGQELLRCPPRGAQP